MVNLLICRPFVLRLLRLEVAQPEPWSRTSPRLLRLRPRAATRALLLPLAAKGFLSRLRLDQLTAAETVREARFIRCLSVVTPLRPLLSCHFLGTCHRRTTICPQALRLHQTCRFLLRSRRSRRRLHRSRLRPFIPLDRICRPLLRCPDITITINLKRSLSLSLSIRLLRCPRILTLTSLYHLPHLFLYRLDIRVRPLVRPGRCRLGYLGVGMGKAGAWEVCIEVDRTGERSLPSPLDPYGTSPFGLSDESFHSFFPLPACPCTNKPRASSPLPTYVLLVAYVFCSPPPSLPRCSSWCRSVVFWYVLFFHHHSAYLLKALLVNMPCNIPQPHWHPPLPFTPDHTRKSIPRSCYHPPHQYGIYLARPSAYRSPIPQFSGSTSPS